ncbi:hypothetical protein [Streptomyces qinzhouensis]|uniref:Uncharacterized protein n=1 Tax=Streptomyces qinzhouensis TaxID=2599401 RepID=A0A5B8IG06_9ACTN|nr:hypothetical protein [Streptomyces qinzhouensis]QDY77488.1 hypothetical protein FQU76_14210 [Streptomyces qinzhouensis]
MHDLVRLLIALLPRRRRPVAVRRPVPPGDPWTRPWTSPSKEEAQAILRRRRRRLYVISHGIYLPPRIPS